MRQSGSGRSITRTTWEGSAIAAIGRPVRAKRWHRPDDFEQVTLRNLYAPARSCGCLGRDVNKTPRAAAIAKIGLPEDLFRPAPRRVVHATPTPISTRNSAKYRRCDQWSVEFRGSSVANTVELDNPELAIGPKRCPERLCSTNPKRRTKIARMAENPSAFTILRGDSGSSLAHRSVLAAPTIRPIFGTIRYMSSGNTAKKLWLAQYLAKHGDQPRCSEGGRASTRSP